MVVFTEIKTLQFDEKLFRFLEFEIQSLQTFLVKINW